MNSEELIWEASLAIESFQRKHNCTCYLAVISGKVACFTRKEVNILPPQCLILTPYQQREGLTKTHWESVGGKLIELYDKEILCHKPHEA